MGKNDNIKSTVSADLKIGSSFEEGQRVIKALGDSSSEAARSVANLYKELNQLVTSVARDQMKAGQAGTYRASRSAVLNPSAPAAKQVSYTATETARVPTPEQAARMDRNSGREAASAALERSRALGLSEQLSTQSASAKRVRKFIGADASVFGAMSRIQGALGSEDIQTRLRAAGPAKAAVSLQQRVAVALSGKYAKSEGAKRQLPALQAAFESGDQERTEAILKSMDAQKSMDAATVSAETYYEQRGHAKVKEEANRDRATQLASRLSPTDPVSARLRSLVGEDAPVFQRADELTEKMSSWSPVVRRKAMEDAQRLVKAQDAMAKQLAQGPGSSPEAIAASEQLQESFRSGGIGEIESGLTSVKALQAADSSGSRTMGQAAAREAAKAQAETKAKSIAQELEKNQHRIPAADYNSAMQGAATAAEYAAKGEGAKAKAALAPASTILKDLKSRDTAEAEDIGREGLGTRYESLRDRARSRLADVTKYAPLHQVQAAEQVRKIEEKMQASKEKTLALAQKDINLLEKKQKRLEEISDQTIDEGKKAEQAAKKAEDKEKSTRFTRLGSVLAASKFLSSVNTIAAAGISGGPQGVGAAGIGLGTAMGAGLQNLSASSIINKGPGLLNVGGFALGAVANLAGSIVTALNDRGQKVMQRADASRATLGPLVTSNLAAAGISPEDILLGSGGGTLIGGGLGRGTPELLDKYFGPPKPKGASTGISKRELDIVTAVATKTGERVDKVRSNLSDAKKDMAALLLGGDASRLPEFLTTSEGANRLFARLEHGAFEGIASWNFKGHQNKDFERNARKAGGTSADAARRAATSHIFALGAQGSITRENAAQALSAFSLSGSQEFADKAIVGGQRLSSIIDPVSRSAIGAAVYAKKNKFNVNTIAQMASLGGDFGTRGLETMARVSGGMGFLGGARDSFLNSMTGAMQGAAMQGVRADYTNTALAAQAATNLGGSPHVIAGILKQSIAGSVATASSVTKGAGAFIEQMSLAHALGQTGDHFAAQDLLRTMTPEQKTNIAAQASPWLTEADLRSKGVDGETAKAWMAGSAVPADENDPMIRLRNHLDKQYAEEELSRDEGDWLQAALDLKAESTVTTEQRMERAANKLDEAAVTFAHAVNAFGTKVMDMF